MKKLVFAAIFIVFLFVGLPVFAQNQKNDRKDSEYYYVNMTLEKVYPYRRGYVVMYRKGLFQFNKAFLPAEWFTDADSKGEIIVLPPGKVWPSLTVYYKNGKFSHVRLYVHRWANHPSWGNIPQNIQLDDQFDNVESVTLEF